MREDLAPLVIRAATYLANLNGSLLVYVTDDERG